MFTWQDSSGKTTALSDPQGRKANKAVCSWKNMIPYGLHCRTQAEKGSTWTHYHEPAIPYEATKPTILEDSSMTTDVSWTLGRSVGALQSRHVTRLAVGHWMTV